jgi:photosystem II stability/assembly factor-like uncharacterized protein
MMKMRIASCALLLFVCAVALTSQTGWQTCQSGTTHDLHDIQQLPADFGSVAPYLLCYAAGDSGTILKSSDGGKSWLPVAVHSNENISSLEFINPDTAFASASNGTILRSNDAGATWDSISGIGISSSLNAISLLNLQLYPGSKLGWAVGDQGIILKTTDRGRTWLTLNSNTKADLHSVSSLNTRFLWACGDSGVILHSTNAGLTWSRQAPYTPDDLYDIKVRPAAGSGLYDTVWSVGKNGRILFSNTSGAAWTEETSHISVTLRKISLTTIPGTVYVSGDSGIVLRTDDFGATWRKVPTGVTNNLYTIGFADQLNGFAAGQNGVILQTAFGGDYVPKFSTCTNLNFGSVIIGERKTGSIFVTNTGTAPLNISSATITGSGWTMVFDSTTLQSLESKKFVIEYAPLDYGERYGKIVFHHNAGDSTSLLLYGFGSVKMKESKWAWRNPVPLGCGITNVRFIDNTTAFAVGDNGSVMKSTDGGIQWTATLNAGGNLNLLFGICFPTKKTGFAVGNEGAIVRTTDGGEHWSRQASGSIVDLSDVCFTDETHGIVVGLGGCGGEGGAILRTTDGGETWIDMSKPEYPNFCAVHFISPEIGFITGSGGTILRTTDGGATWNKIFSGTLNCLAHMHFTDQNNGKIFGYDNENFRFDGSNMEVLNTTDGGVSWSSEGIPAGGANYPPTAVAFFDAVNGVGFNIAGYLVKTTDGGMSWTQGALINEYAVLYYCALACTQNGGVVLAGGNFSRHSDASVMNTFEVYANLPLLYHSSDGGNTFENLVKLPVPEYTFAGAASDINHAIVIGGEATVYKTNDGGVSWEKLLNGSILASLGYYFSSVAMVDSNTAYIVGGPGLIIRTTDGGTSWDLQTPGLTDYFYGCTFRDANHGFVVGDNGILLFTSDGGTHWINRSNSTLTRMNDIAPTDSDTWSGVNYRGMILKTTDNGITWDSTDPGMRVELNGISFSDPMNGVIVGRGIILHTSDGGAHWIAKNLESAAPYYWNEGVYLTDVSMTKNGSGYAVGYYGLILHTSDFGVTWEYQASGTGSALFSVQTIDSNHAITTGQNSAILQLGGSGVTGVKRVISADIPKKFALAQNYPNPFNPMTTIRFDVPIASDVSLKIYDILGREVAVLANERKLPGHYEARWNAASYASGVYFYRLQANGFVETKKLLLMR